MKHSGTKAMVLFLLGLAAIAGAEKIEAGHFAGVQVQPLLGARASLLGIEPAAVIVFAADSEDLQPLVDFDAWFRQEHAYDYPIYGIGVGASDASADVLEEVLRQRELKLPVFFTRSTTLLHGGKFRVLLLDKGNAEDLKDTSAAVLETRMNALAKQAGLVAKAGAVPVATPAEKPAPSPAETTATVEVAKAGTYSNMRYSFSIKFPPGWTYQAAQNGDGAVGQPPEGSELDLRTWALPNNEAEDGSPGAMTMPEYLTRHLGFVGEQNKTRVSLDRRLVVSDNDLEGRDYTYSYVKSSSRTRRNVQMRGRIEVYEVNGVFKVAAAEGPVKEFDSDLQLIEDFMVSFDPRID